MHVGPHATLPRVACVLEESRNGNACMQSCSSLAVPRPCRCEFTGRAICKSINRPAYSCPVLPAVHDYVRRILAVPAGHHLAINRVAQAFWSHRHWRQAWNCSSDVVSCACSMLEGNRHFFARHLMHLRRHPLSLSNGDRHEKVQT